MKIKNRYGDTINYIYKTDNIINVYSDDSISCRVCGEKDNIIFIDFSGGPFIRLGDKFDNRTVSKIVYNNEKGFDLILD